ncbi:hypothetical protein [Tenggerimyces flavus]|uniref:Septum formation-related domain-containing protein n=1 Tax=Tenggerimyces flavus TaxID=1708749 RepID=A0ABV7Y5V7_9ACTN|nr:hypothetical protein [Tenggerimyces flavus]MBM7788352.1 hypothetical protein [Tenggerimyces flavus]
MTDAIVGELRSLAGAELYRRNAFRLSGLPANVDRRTTRQLLQRLKAALEVGADVDFGTTASRDPHELQAACDLILGDPRRRLVHEVFGPWGDDVSACECERDFHRRHDAAVDAHATAIEAELAGTQSPAERDAYWKAASHLWANVLESEETWDHLVSRVEQLDDRQLDLRALDGIEDELPRALLKPLTDLATANPAEAPRLAALANAWPAENELTTQLLERAAQPLYEELDAHRLRLTDQLQAEGPPDPVANDIQRTLLPLLEKLDALLPPARHHRTATLHDQLAILLNNCAVKLLDTGDVTDGRAETWLSLAAELAIDPREQALVAENQQALRTSAQVLGDFEQRIYDEYTRRGEFAALFTLHEVHRSTDAQPVRDAVDRMLAEIKAGTFTRRHQERRGTYKPAATRPTPTRPPRARRPKRPKRPKRRGRTGRVVFWLAVAAAVVFALYQWGTLGSLIGQLGQEGPGPNAVNAWAAKIADNAKVGTCLDEQNGDWRANPGALRSIDCGQPHWAEILGYVRLGPVPGPYPGDDQATALATFSCGEQLARQRLPRLYQAEEVHSRAKDWNTGKVEGYEYENYAVCILRGTDDQPISAGRKLKTAVPDVPMPVQMELYGGAIAANAPVGTCIQSQGKIAQGGVIGKVPVVRCEAKHWAQVVGYPAIGKQGEKWPGDKAVFDRAKQACAKLISRREGFTTSVGFPDKTWWDNPKLTIYTFCAAHRVDGKPWEGRL